MSLLKKGYNCFIFYCTKDLIYTHNKLNRYIEMPDKTLLLKKS